MLGEGPTPFTSPRSITHQVGFESPKSICSLYQSPCIVPEFNEINTPRIPQPSGSNRDQGHTSCHKSKTNNINGGLVLSVRGWLLT